ncbi:MAG: hypothetical protein Kow006_20650 [Gammaproteobacteria bacterium]
MVMPFHHLRLLPGLCGLAGLLLIGAVQAAEGSSGISEEERLFQAKCGECHPSERIFLVEMTPEQRRHVVLRMRERLEAGAKWLSDEEVDKLLSYVEARRKSDDAIKPQAKASPKELFRERCKGCHELDRIYEQVKTEREKPSAWLHVVARMQAKAPQWISKEEADQIIDYLRSRTVPKSGKR